MYIYNTTNSKDSSRFALDKSNYYNSEICIPANFQDGEITVPDISSIEISYDDELPECKFANSNSITHSSNKKIESLPFEIRCDTVDTLNEIQSNMDSTNEEISSLLQKITFCEDRMKESYESFEQTGNGDHLKYYIILYSLHKGFEDNLQELRNKYNVLFKRYYDLILL